LLPLHTATPPAEGTISQLVCAPLLSVVSEMLVTPLSNRLDSSPSSLMPLLLASTQILSFGRALLSVCQGLASNKSD
jgi:hypothetical protein